MLRRNTRGCVEECCGIFLFRVLRWGEKVNNGMGIYQFSINSTVGGYISAETDPGSIYVLLVRSKSTTFTT